MDVILNGGSPGEEEEEKRTPTKRPTRDSTPHDLHTIPSAVRCYFIEEEVLQSLEAPLILESANSLPLNIYLQQKRRAWD